MTAKRTNTRYSSKLAREICSKIASTSHGLKKLCDDNPHWPNKDTIFTWLKNKPEFADWYARSKRIQIEYIVDEMLEIADNAINDCMTDTDGKLVFNSQAVQRARLQIDTRKWLACKLVPRIYGVQPLIVEEEKRNTPQTLKGITDQSEASRIYQQIMQDD